MTLWAADRKSPPLFVMAGLDPAIHETKDVDPRDKPRDDVEGVGSP